MRVRPSLSCEIYCDAKIVADKRCIRMVPLRVVHSSLPYLRHHNDRLFFLAYRVQAYPVRMKCCPWIGDNQG